MRLFDRLAALARSRSPRRRPTGWIARRPLGELLEARQVLSANPLTPGNPCAPELDLSAIVGNQTLTQYEVGEMVTLDLPANGATLVDRLDENTTTDVGLRWLADPDTGVDFPTGATLTADGVFEWDLTEVDPGDYLVRIIGIDDDPDGALSTSDAFTITVLTPPNPPMIVSPTDGDGDVRNMTVNTTLTFEVVATDPDPNDDLMFTVPISPFADLGANDSPTLIERGDTRVADFSWTPIEPGVYDFIIAVDDGTGTTTATQNLRINVFEVNAAPTIDAIADQSSDAGAELEVVINITDTNTDPVQNLNPTVRIQGSSVDERIGVDNTAAAPDFRLVEGAVNGDTRQFLLRWNPTNADVGVYDVTVDVTDNGFLPGADSEEFQLTINPAPEAPVIDNILDDTVPLPSMTDETTMDVTFSTTVEEDVLFELTVAASDANGDAITYTLLNDPTGASNPAATLDPSTGVFSWTPAEPGTYEFQVQASDGSLTSEVTLSVEVTETPVAPMLDPIAGRTVGPASGEQGFALNGSDENPGDTLDYAWSVPDGITLTNTPVVTDNPDRTASFSWTPDPSDFPDSNAIEFTITLTDGTGTTPAVETFTVTLDDIGPMAIMGPNGVLAPTTQLTVVFNEPVNASLEDFRLELTQGMIVPITIDSVASTQPDTYIVNLASPLAEGDYALRISSNGIVDAFGNEMESDAGFVFVVMTELI